MMNQDNVIVIQSGIAAWLKVICGVAAGAFAGFRGLRSYWVLAIAVGVYLAVASTQYALYVLHAK